MDSERQWVFSADPRGRIGWVHTPETSYRRSRFNEWYRIQHNGWKVLEPVASSHIEESVARWEPVWQRALDRASRDETWSQSFKDTLRTWVGDFLEFHHRDAVRFRSIYQAIPILPPDAYQSLYIQLSSGCPWNRCVFCSFYRNRDYKIPSDRELWEHLRAVRSYWERALGSRSGLFLGDANATAVPTEIIVERCRRIREVFHEAPFRRLSSFADLFTRKDREATDFGRLAQIGLHRICFGVESGSDELLEQIQKPTTSSDGIRVVRETRRGGIHVSLIFIVGLGGRRYRDRHYRSSIDLLSRLPIARPDRIYLSPLRVNSIPDYRNMAARNDWGYLDNGEIKIEMNRWTDSIHDAHPDLPVSLYNIGQFTY
jgi:hypothetical protein